MLTDQNREEKENNQLQQKTIEEANNIKRRQILVFGIMPIFALPCAEFSQPVCKPVYATEVSTSYYKGVLQEDTNETVVILNKAKFSIPEYREPLPEKNEELNVLEVETIYDCYSEEELDLLFRVVEAEATGGDVESKSHVASVIFNRIADGWHGGDLTENIMSKNQFEVITNGRYKKMTVTEDTILACEMAFESDTAQGALFFDSTNGKSWAAKNKTFIFRDSIGHDFYK